MFFFPKETSNAPVFLGMSLSGQGSREGHVSEGAAQNPTATEGGPRRGGPRLPLGPAVRPRRSSIRDSSGLRSRG